MELKHDERTPCEVVVAPGTIFGIGVPVETIIHAIRERGLYPRAKKELADYFEARVTAASTEALDGVAKLLQNASPMVVGYALKADNSNQVHHYGLSELEFAKGVVKSMPGYKLYPVLLGEPM